MNIPGTDLPSTATKEGRMLLRELWLADVRYLKQQRLLQYRKDRAYRAQCKQQYKRKWKARNVREHCAATFTSIYNFRNEYRTLAAFPSANREYLRWSVLKLQKYNIKANFLP